MPEPVSNLLALQRARIELGAAGARTAEVRGGRLSVIPLELDAATVGRLRERIPEAMYELRTRTLSLRVGDDPGERLEALLELTDGARRRDGRRAGRRLSARILSLPLARCRYAAEPVSPQGKRSRPQTAAAAQLQPAAGRSSAAKRIGLVVFGALLVALFVIVAVAQGIGDPSVPADAIAVVEDAPDGTITKEEFDRALAQTAARQGLKEVPKTTDPQYQPLADAAESDLLLVALGRRRGAGARDRDHRPRDRRRARQGQAAAVRRLGEGSSRSSSTSPASPTRRRDSGSSCS